MKEIIQDSQALIYDKGLVTIVEIMGRNAGWLVGAAALSKGEDCDGPDLIYVPELPFDIDNFLVRIKELLAERLSLWSPSPKASAWRTDVMCASSPTVWISLTPSATSSSQHRELSCPPSGSGDWLQDENHRA